VRNERLQAGERGFTLMEVLVAVVMISILAAIAIPNYSQYVTRSNRAAAKQVLLEVAGELERRYTTNGCYDRASVTTCVDRSGAAPALSTSQAPKEGAAKYAIGVAYGGATGQQFTLTAAPNFTDSECGSLTLTQTGARGLVIGGTASADAALINRCWAR
jgi:type IV pilus assembly protein PilE